MLVHLLSFSALNNGSLVTAELEPASHFSVIFPPYVSYETQESIYSAWLLSSYKRGVQVKFHQNVVGPSGGLAFYMAFECMAHHRDCSKVCATGVIERNGAVLPIGGLVEKMKAAIDGGCREIYVPEQNPLFLLILSRSSNKSIYMVKSVRDGMVFHEPRLNLPSIPSQPYHPSHRYEVEWASIYHRMRDAILRKAQRYGVEDEVVPYVYATDKIADKGYYYGASNYLFQLLVDFNMADRFFDGSSHLSCPKPNVMWECLDEDAGAAARWWWAYESNETDPDTAAAWCLASQLMDEVCNGTTPIMANPQVFAHLFLGVGSDDVRGAAAVSAIKSGDVPAALYSLAFVKGNKTYDGYWADVYGSQAALLNESSLLLLGEHIDYNMRRVKRLEGLGVVLWILERLLMN